MRSLGGMLSFILSFSFAASFVFLASRLRLLLSSGLELSVLYGGIGNVFYMIEVYVVCFVRTDVTVWRNFDERRWCGFGSEMMV
jgi:hypothetical protein